MQTARKSKISELQAIMTKMPLEVCCIAALPEFGVRWREVSKAVRNARLPMSSASVARVICRHVAKSLPPEDVDDIAARLRLKLVATQTRTWHVVQLEGGQGEPGGEATVARRLPARIRQALKGRSRNMTPEVQTVMMGDLLYLSVQLVSGEKQGSILYVAVAAGQSVMLVSSLTAAGLLKAVVEALGYAEYSDGRLHGGDARSLLRLRARARPPAPAPYAPRPARARDGVDYTQRAYDQQYVDQVLGPDPPHLTHLNITTTRSFFDPSRLNKQMSLTVDLRSEDVARSLKAWAAKGALAPSSDLLLIYTRGRSNRISYSREDSD